MTAQEFIAKWAPGGPAADLNERSGAQPHFMDLCALLGVPTPGTLSLFCLAFAALLVSRRTAHRRG